MDFVENIRMGEEGAETGFGAEIDGASTVFDSREVCRIRVAEYTSAKGDEAWMVLLFQEMYLHREAGARES